MDQSVETAAAVPARMCEAWNRGDAAGFFADFTDDARLVEFEGTIVQGREALIQGQVPLFDTVLKGSRLVDSTVLFAEEVSPGTVFLHHRAGLLMAGETEPLPTRITMQLYVLRRLENRWQVVALQNGRVLSFEHSAHLDALVSE
ncbi:SgcJ/EcaC family oxidoreductase [Kineosporia rhizophila]|uniref:SgcJ/EcaC family oxidoreductase n=1 Tax=Kineosporia TaxID=49184 RepID=UPI001E3F964D|nr:MULTISPECIES: SgcJ/EcaC family oxidoreductase [Kineosporia]MCE0538697.1 SgcJ/EcaC family oxidoreductase [Kineosporia rhizophila]GLY19475.1 hypothetical protein Kisp01_64890 [Kineosporia sp. NBRC 101677]